MNISKIGNGTKNMHKPLSKHKVDHGLLRGNRFEEVFNFNVELGKLVGQAKLYSIALYGRFRANDRTSKVNSQANSWCASIAHTHNGRPVPSTNCS